MGILVLAGSGSARQGAAPIPVLPPPGAFVSRIDNKYFPLRPGTTFLFRGTEEGKARRVSVFVTHKTKMILGIRATVVLDQVLAGGKREEKTFDWYAQDKQGNVWYLGEDSSDFVNGKWVRSDGSWEAGVKGAKPGIVMKANPRVGEIYRQEYYAGHAEDMAKVLSRNKPVTVAYGSFEHALETSGWYAFVRHPGYLGALLASWGAAVAFGSALALPLAGVLTLVQLDRVRREERLLAGHFGEAWSEYARRTGALLPRSPARRAAPEGHEKAPPRVHRP